MLSFHITRKSSEIMNRMGESTREGSYWPKIRLSTEKDNNSNRDKQIHKFIITPTCMRIHTHNKQTKVLMCHFGGY